MVFSLVWAHFSTNWRESRTLLWSKATEPWNHLRVSALEVKTNSLSWWSVLWLFYMHVTTCFSSVCDGGRVQDLKMSEFVFTPTRSPALVPDKKYPQKPAFMTFRKPTCFVWASLFAMSARCFAWHSATSVSMDTTTAWLDMKSCTCPVDCDSMMSRMTSLQECALLREQQRGTKKTHTSACKHLIAFFPAKCPKPPGVAQRRRLYLHPFHLPFWSENKCLSICRSTINFFPFLLPPFCL